MNESDAKPQQPERKLNQEQYDMLKRCSKKKDVTEWNEWRKANPDEEIWLSGADFRGAYMEGDIPEGPLLKGAVLSVGPNPEVLFWGARVEGAELWEAHLEGANLRDAHLEGAILRDAHLEGADLRKAHLKGVRLAWAHLEGAKLWYAHLEDAELRWAHLEGADLWEAHLEGADFTVATVDGKTVIWGPDIKINKETYFTGVGLDAARVDPGLKQLLQYNVRRRRWRKWYKDHRLLTPLVWLFWQMSDYGRSTGRVIGTFFVLALLFAGIYYACGLIWYPGIVSNLFGDEQVPLQAWLVPFRAIYFSIVTMTTLGFGDMYAQPDSFWGHICLVIQVILGYILLGALITRFAVLFTAGGPAAKFADERKTTWRRFVQTLRVNWKLIRRRKGQVK